MTPLDVSVVSYFRLTVANDLSTMEKTTLSSKGQVILPKIVRQVQDWAPGTEFSVEDVDEGVVLRPLKPFKPTKIEDAFGCLSYEGPAKTLVEMEEAISTEVRKRHESGRY